MPKKISKDKSVANIVSNIIQCQHKHIKNINEMDAISFAKEITANDFFQLHYENCSLKESIEKKVNSRLQASYETIFGNYIEKASIEIAYMRFPIVKIPQKGSGLDLIVEDYEPYERSIITDCPNEPIYLLQIKASPFWSNSTSMPKQCELLDIAGNHYGYRSVQIIGHCQGKNYYIKNNCHLIFGNDYWHFITGHDDIITAVNCEMQSKKIPSKLFKENFINRVYRELA